MLESTGRRLEEIQAYVADHPELKRPFYHVPHTEGVTGTAANFVLHVSDRMSRRRPVFARLKPRATGFSMTAGGQAARSL